MVLDGTNGVLWGNGRIGEKQPGGCSSLCSECFASSITKGDALSSVGQLADASVNITLARSYDPFGDPLMTSSTRASIDGFAGEQRDAAGLVCLLALYDRGAKRSIP